MAILDNNPTFTYISIKNLMVTYDKQMYSVQNMYTNKKYLYWDYSLPYQLEESNTRKPQIAGRYLIAINDKGIHTQVENDDIILSFDGDNMDLISEKIFGIYDKTDEFDRKFVTVETDIEGLRTTVGDIIAGGGGGESDGIHNVIMERISKIEQKADSIDLSVQEVTKEYNDNKEMNELRENLNKSIIELNSSLGIFKSKMPDYYKDNIISQEEKVEINTQIDIVKKNKSEVLVHVDTVILLMESQDLTENVNKLNSSKNQMVTAIDNLITVINSAISDNTIVPSEVTLITNAFGSTNVKINQMKNTCDEMVFLGSGGSISTELARIGLKSDEILLSVSKVEENLKSEVSLIKSELESQIKDVDSALDNFKDVVNGSFKDGIIDEAEREILLEKIKLLDKEKTDIDERYESFFNDVNIDSVAKNVLKESYDKYCSKHQELKNKIEEVISDSLINDAEKQAIDTLFSEYALDLATMNTSMNKAIDSIISNKNKEEIKNAKDELQGQITDVSDKVDDLDHIIDGTFENNILDETERMSIKQNLEIIELEKIDIDNMYNELCKNLFLDGEVKNDFVKTYEDFNLKYSNFIEVVNGILDKTEYVTDEDRINISNSLSELKASIGNYSAQYQKTLDYVKTKEIENAKDILKGEIADVDAKIDSILDDVGGAIADGIIDEAESIIIVNNLNQLSKEKLDVDERYSIVYENPSLIGDAKDNLKTCKDEFDVCIQNVIDVINEITEDLKVTDEEKVLFEGAIELYYKSSAKLNGAFEMAIDSISNENNSNLQEYIDNIKAEVDKANEILNKEIGDVQLGLGNLEDELNGSFKDGIIDEAEVLIIRQQLEQLEKEKVDIDSTYSQLYNNPDLI